MKILPVEAQLFLADGRIGGQTDRRTDNDDAIIRFSKFCGNA